MPVEFLRVGPDQIAVFDCVADDVFDAAIDRERLESYLAAPGHLMILAVEAGVVVAQCAAVVHRHPDKVTELYIDELGTAASHRRQGIARQLIDAMFDWGRELGCKESWLGTNSTTSRRMGCTPRSITDSTRWRTTSSICRCSDAQGGGDRCGFSRVRGRRAADRGP
jgi:GNAT superfamily N-acetyltransferase